MTTIQISSQFTWLKVPRVCNSYLLRSRLLLMNNKCSLELKLRGCTRKAMVHSTGSVTKVTLTVTKLTYRVYRKQLARYLWEAFKFFNLITNSWTIPRWLAPKRNEVITKLFRVTSNYFKMSQITTGKVDQWSSKVGWQTATSTCLRMTATTTEAMAHRLSKESTSQWVQLANSAKLAQKATKTYC